MKKLTFLFSIFSLSIFTGFAQEPQVPQAFNYTGYAVDASGKEISNKLVSVKAYILEGTFDGASLYEETHKTMTDHKGFFNVKVGRGTSVFGSFESIDWAGGPKYLKIEIDPKGGSNYQFIGSVELLSVPYAFYAGNALNAEDADADPENELQNLEVDPVEKTLTISNGNVVDLSGIDDPTDEIQDLILEGTTLRISNNPQYTPIDLGSVFSMDGRIYYGDSDKDNYGNPFNPLWLPLNVEPPADFINDNTDCQDLDAGINPGMVEILDGIDNDCDGQIDEEICVDNDGDGYGNGAACLGPDCDDNDPDIYDCTTACTGDQDCDNGFCNENNECETRKANDSPCSRDGECLSGICIDGYCVSENPNIDLDEDGFTVGEGDCNDNNPDINPDALEICDGIDNDCNGLVDDGAASLCIAGPHATTQCLAGQCITSCDPNWFDIDGDPSNGCECQADAFDSFSQGNSCASATNLSPLSPGSSVSVSGNSVPVADSDWYRIYVNCTTTSTAINFQFENNPGAVYSYDIYSGGAGGCGALTLISSNTKGFVTSSCETGYYYIRVFVETSQAMCEPYTFSITNVSE